MSEKSSWPILEINRGNNFFVGHPNRLMGYYWGPSDLKIMVRCPLSMSLYVGKNGLFKI
uniref:Uncharacterized protein n=1 Tax=Nelumbo nucifera TaxID=4432 RepID=A0A822Z1H3_NELNU|nr:TPA_asm: hypothetical protein HUJ06_014577 [Nelumbo nucifera]